MTELDFIRSDYDTAASSHDIFILAQLAEHPSRYIRARVAGNPHTPEHIRAQLWRQAGRHSGILLWLLGNPSLTRAEFITIFTEYIGQTYDANVHISLAASRHATTSELATLLHFGQWAVTMAVLNNYQGRNQDEYRSVISNKKLLPDEDLAWEQWSEVEKLAYFRTTGRRRPPNST